MPAGLVTQLPSVLDSISTHNPHIVSKQISLTNIKIKKNYNNNEVERMVPLIFEREHIYFSTAEYDAVAVCSTL